MLSHDEQNARILRWADIVDEARLDAALAGLPKEAKKQVTDLRTTMQVLKIQKVCTSQFSATDTRCHRYNYADHPLMLKNLLHSFICASRCSI